MEMNDNRLVLLKLGGSLITDKNKPFTARREVIIRLGKEIKSALAEFDGRLIIAHGSGSFGHSVAEKYKVAEGMGSRKSRQGLPLVADAAARINRIVIKCLLSQQRKFIGVLRTTVAGLPISQAIADLLIFGEQYGKS